MTNFEKQYAKVNDELRDCGIDTLGHKGVRELGQKHEAALEKIQQLEYTITELADADVRITAKYNGETEEVDFALEMRADNPVHPEDLVHGLLEYAGMILKSVKKNVEEVSNDGSSAAEG